MEDLIEEILSYGTNKRKEILKDLCRILERFLEHELEHEEDQASEIFSLTEDFPDTEGMDDEELRAWLILAYQGKFYDKVPSRSAVEDALSAIRAYDKYGDKFYEWRNNGGPKKCMWWYRKTS